MYYFIRSYEEEYVNLVIDISDLNIISDVTKIPRHLSLVVGFLTYNRSNKVASYGF